MGVQESGEVLTRGRKVENNTLAPQENVSQKQTALPESSNFTAHNAEFDRRRAELKKQMTKDRAAAEAELLRLSSRCDILKEFIFEADTAAEELENLSAIINAEKEFAARMEQLEIRYYRSWGRFSENLYQECSSTFGKNEPNIPLQAPGSIKSSLPLIGAIIFAALIISAAMAMIFL